jgi:hypothetical protein
VTKLNAKVKVLSIEHQGPPKGTIPRTFSERVFSITFAWISEEVLLYAHLVTLNIVYSLQMFFMLSAKYYTRVRELDAQ